MNSFNFLLKTFLFKEFDEKMIGAIAGQHISTSLLASRSYPFQEGYIISKNLFDSISSNHSFQESKNRLSKKYNKHSDEVIYMFYEHFLAINWENYSSIPMNEYTLNLENLLNTNSKTIPYTINKLLHNLCRNNWGNKISSIQGLHSYMTKLTKKSNFPILYQDSIHDLSDKYSLFNNDFKKCMYSLNMQTINNTLLLI